MKLHADFTIKNKTYRKGTKVHWKFIYPFFLFHMVIFGASGFFLAYNSNADISLLYMHGIKREQTFLLNENIYDFLHVIFIMPEKIKYRFLDII